MGYLESGGVRLYYEETGRGAPIAFIHEFSGDQQRKRWPGPASRCCEARLAAERVNSLTWIPIRLDVLLVDFIHVRPRFIRMLNNPVQVMQNPLFHLIAGQLRATEGEYPQTGL